MSYTYNGHKFEMLIFTKEKKTVYLSVVESS